MKMLNKKQIQQKKAEEHKLRIAQAKARRRGKTNLERNEPNLKEIPIIFIYCEGKNTEPSYFNKFRLSTITIDSFGEGRNTVSLVERAKKLAEKKDYDQVWCVFDADPKPDNPKQIENFNKAIVLARKYGFGVAYSHQAFEYWLILHFEDHQGGAMSRTDYRDKINSYVNKLGVHYDFNGSKEITQDLFNLLETVIYTNRNGEELTRRDIASQRAEKIYNSYDHSNPGREESSTTVHHLVEELIKYR